MEELTWCLHHCDVYGGLAVVGNTHRASDVVFGAFLGMTSGRTARCVCAAGRFSITPMAVAGGGVAVTMRVIS
jgi:hypothetical protein